MRTRSAIRPGCGRIGDIGRAARFGVDDDLLFVILGRRIVHRHAGGGREIGQHAFDQNLIIAAPGAEDGQRLTFKIVGRVKGVVAVPVERAFADREFQVLRHGATGEKRQCSGTDDELRLHGLPPVTPAIAVAGLVCRVGQITPAG